MFLPKAKNDFKIIFILKNNFKMFITYIFIAIVIIFIINLLRKK